MRTCENCNSLHDGIYGSGRFCSPKCARGFSTKDKRAEINSKVSEKLKGCKVWNKGHIGVSEETSKKISQALTGRKLSLQHRRNIQKAAIGRKASISTREKLSNIQKQKVLNGTHKGWKSRNKFEPSYPEKFFINVLNNNNIEFEREKHVGKYFIDFAITSKMIALEIDGKQHEYEERKFRDANKDEFLLKLGWTIHRIKWKNPVNEENKSYIEAEIKKFLELLSN